MIPGIVRTLLTRGGSLAIACALPVQTIAALPAPAPSVAPPGGDVRIIRSDEHALVFEYRPDYGAPDTLEGGFIRMDFSGSTPADALEKGGEPDLRYRLFPLAFPSREGNAVRVIAADYRDISAVRYAPIAAVQLKDGKFQLSGPAPDKRVYGQNLFLPQEVVQLSPARRSRSMFLGNVRVYPVQYNPSTQVARKYSRVVVEVTFGATTAPRVSNSDDLPLRNVLLNYPAARLWKTNEPGATVRAIGPSVLATGQWYRLTVDEGGIYKLDASYLATAGIDVSKVDPRTIKIYGNGGAELSESIGAGRPTDLVENAIDVEGESDGKFDAGDYVLFYGKPVSGWKYDPNARTMHHYRNRYSDHNYYWLTYGGSAGKRMSDQLSPSASPDVVTEQTEDAVFLEEEKRNLLESGKDWLGQNLDYSGSSFTYRTSLPGLVSGGTIRYRFTVWNGSEGSSSFSVKEGGSSLGTYAMSPVHPPVNRYLDYTITTGEASGTSSLASDASQLTFTYSGPGNPHGAYIDWFEIFYPRMLWGVSEYLHFWSPDTTGVVEYHLQQFTAPPWVFNVSSPEDVRRVTGISGSYLFRAAATGGERAEYCAAGPASWKTPTEILSMTNENLRGYADGADYIIITSSEFRTAAERLAAYRQQPAHGNLKTVVVDVQQIFNEFGGGLADPTSIRDFLKYAYDNWSPRPYFVVFFGAASFDYKGILGTKGSFVPTWESPESRDEVASYASDDFFAKFGSTNAPSLVLGRINSRTSAEADAFVSKLIHYEGSSAHDGWKQRMLFVGDDAWTAPDGNTDGTQHSADAETLSSSLYTPNEFEKKKIYIAEYPTVFTALGRRKPGAYQDIIDQLNQGVLVFNYAGHGNENLLAHEDIFDVSTSLPQLTNIDRLAYFFLATCDFSHYDNPLAYTGSEALINAANGGAIGVVSASRKVYAGLNANLNQGTYSYMFSRDAYGRLVVERPATALFLYKSIVSNNINDQKYFCMGDPAMQLQYPALRASIDSIDGEPVDSVGGAPRLSPVHIRALSAVRVSGTMRAEDNRVDSTASGTMLLTLNDPSHQQVIVNFTPGMNWAYLAPGATLYRGESSVAGGRFVATFIVPKDIANIDSTSRGRLAGYFYNSASDGAAYTGNVNISGTDTTTANSGQGPAISIYLGSRGFRPGDVVSDNTVMYVDFADSNGVNTSAAGIGHRIEAWFNNSTQSTDLTALYTSALDNFREGTLQYSLKELPIGRNTVRIRAWDSFDNSATAETYFEVASGEQLQIFDVMNYPNPFSSATSFTFRQNLTEPIDVVVKIYTIAGRLVQTLEEPAGGDSFVRVPWDGRDRDGDILANGVYLYKIVVSTADRRFTSEALGKLAIVK